MAERNEQVLKHVREELAKNPDLTSTQLYETAQKVDPSIAEDSLRSFHARYVLSLKRGAAATRSGRKSARKGARGARKSTGGARRGKRAQQAEAERARIRDVFLQFAREVAGAETRAEVVNAVGSVDRYVDEILG